MYNKNNNNNRGKRTQRPKFEQVTLEKTYESFEEGINDLRETDQNIDCIFFDYQQEPVTTPAEAKAAIVKDLSENIPEFSNKDTKYIALNISSNRVVYKLSTGISFGWKLVYDKETDTTSYRFTVIVATYPAMKYVGSKLIEMFGWEQIQK